jgi:hypothetical protein
MIFCTKYTRNVDAKLVQNRQLRLTGYPKTVAEAYTLLSQWPHEPVVYRPVMSQDTVFSSNMRYDRKVHDTKKISNVTIVARKDTWQRNAGLPEVAKKARSRKAGTIVEAKKVRNSIAQNPIRRKWLLKKKSNGYDVW